MTRRIELDLLRTLAIILMVIYHTGYDLAHFYSRDIDMFHGGWKVLQLSTASLFLLLVGASSSLSSNQHTWKRLLKVGGAALLVSIVTYVIDPETYVRFGILHLIAISALILPIMAPFKTWLLIPGVLLLLLHPFISSIDANIPALLPLGIHADTFRTVDYYPLVPWFGMVMIGYGIGCLVYKNPSVRTLGGARLKIMTWPGQHSLLLYLIHQPIIIGILWIILGTPQT